jgi:hypothetical protein
VFNAVLIKLLEFCFLNPEWTSREVELIGKHFFLSCIRVNNTCSESIGYCLSLSEADFIIISPPTTIVSLLAIAQTLPFFKALRVGKNPLNPTSALTTISTSLSVDISNKPSSPYKSLIFLGIFPLNFLYAFSSLITIYSGLNRSICSLSNSMLEFVDIAFTLNIFLYSLITSNVFLPIEPVELR